MGIVCRPLLLHNEFVPAKTGERNWDYLMFGHQDGMTVGDLEVFGDASSYASLFDFCQKYENEKHDYFTQIMFCFHANEERENAFWEDEKPFLYITLLQLADDKIEELVSYFEDGVFFQDSLAYIDALNSMDDINILTYHSLGNSDLILMIKCKHAKIGGKIINSLHQNAEKYPFDVRNSYSMLGVREKDIEEDGNLSKEEELIDVLELRIVEKASNSVFALYQKLKGYLHDVKSKAKVEREATLGTEDETIIIRHVMWKHLIPCYRQGTGILRNSNLEASKYSNTISAKVMLTVEAGNEYDYIPPDEPKRLFCDVLAEELKKVYDDSNDERSKTEKKNLLQIINALRRFEYSYRTGQAFSDYNLYSIYMPLYMLIKLLGKSGNVKDKSYYEFMMCIRLRTQNFVKPDRVYTQMTDFNIRYFDIPSKLILLYSAYVYYLKRALNTDSNLDYEFLISPGVSDTTRVMELFCMTSENERLMLIKLPERQTYNVQLMFIILCHEIAHYVGRDVRMRKERADYLIDICSRIICQGMKSYIRKYYKEDWLIIKENWEEAEKNLRQWLRNYLERETDAKYRNKKYGMERAKDLPQETVVNWFDRTDVLEKTLNAVIEEMLRNKGETIFRFTIWDQYQKEKRKSGDIAWESYCESQSRFIQKCLNEFLGEQNRLDDSLNVRNAIEAVVYLLKECYADVICILTLHLSVREYLSAIKENICASQWSVEDISGTLLIPRIALVMQSIHESLGLENPVNGYFRWTDKEFDYSEEEESEIYCLEQLARQYISQYMLAENPDLYIQTKYGASVVLDKHILEEVLCYLKRCQKKFYDFGMSDKKLAYVRDFYSLTKKQDEIVLFENYINLLKRYERDIYKDICRVAEEE